MLRVVANSPAEVLPWVLTTFEHALEVFSFVIRRNERLTWLDWCERIAAAYAPSARRDRLLDAIRDCMLTLDQPPIRRAGELSLLDYVIHGFDGAANLHLTGSMASRAHALGAHLAATGQRGPMSIHFASDLRTVCDGQTYLETAGERF